MKLIRKLWRSITPPKRPSEIPTGLKRIIDRCDEAASVSTYDTEIPLMVYANHKHKSLTGFSIHDIKGKSPMIFYKKDVPDCPRLVMLENLRKDSFWTGEVVNYTKSGKELVLSMTIFGICYEGRKYFVALKKQAR